MAHFCMLCKEIVKDRFKIEIKDTETDNIIHGHVCRFCYNKFIDSANYKGMFGVTSLKNWIKGRSNKFELR